MAEHTIDAAELARLIREWHYIINETWTLLRGGMGGASVLHPRPSSADDRFWQLEVHYARLRPTAKRLAQAAEERNINSTALFVLTGNLEQATEQAWDDAHALVQRLSVISDMENEGRKPPALAEDDWVALKAVSGWVADTPIIRTDRDGKKHKYQAVPDFLVAAVVAVAADQGMVAKDAFDRLVEARYLIAGRFAEETSGVWKHPDGRSIIVRRGTVAADGDWRSQHVVEIDGSPVLETHSALSSLWVAVYHPVTVASMDKAEFLAKHKPTEAEDSPPAPPAVDAGSDQTDDPSTSPAAAEPITGDEVTALLNKLLSVAGAWGWKQAKRWLERHGVTIYDREGWRNEFGTEPPTKKGSLALVNFADLWPHLQADATLSERAFEVMDDVAAARTTQRTGQ